MTGVSVAATYASNPNVSPGNMQLQRADNLAGIGSPAATAALMRAGGGGDAFGRGLRTQMEKATAPAATRQEQVREAANQLVAVAFVKPLLEQIHQSPLRGDLFHGGQGEEAFQGHLDTLLADRIAQRMSTGLADAIYKSMQRGSTGSLSSKGFERAG